MKFPVSMLRDFVTTSLSAEEIGDVLTMAGFELEGIETVEGDDVLDIKVVSNRGDGLSVFGLTREILAKDAAATATDLYRRACDRFPLPDVADTTIANRVTARIETDDCSRFACRMFTGLRPASSPDWMQLRLRQAGMRPISLTVDLTNYVMLELGQPLHAFDFDKLRNGIVVRRARPGEKLTTLNGDEHELREDQMMICDGERPVSAAGIMGGLDTEVSDATSTVLLESAHFLNTSIRRTRKQLGLSTEASYRFERSVDPEGVVGALNRYAELLGNHVEIVPGVLDVYPRPPEKHSLTVRMSRTVRLLGLPISAAEARGYLERLGFEVNGDGEPFTVNRPTWRPDIVREDDVIEEIGRVHGFDRIPETLPHGATTRGGVPPLESAIDEIRTKLIAAGFVQAISHTLRDAHPLDGASPRIGPRNPGSPELALLRNSTLPSLADAARRNGGRDVHLCELGRVFSQGADGFRESRQLGLLSQGALSVPFRANESVPQADFFSLKGVIEALAPGLIWSAPAEPDPRFHPTRQAAVGEIGIVGVIHPDVADGSGLPADTVMAELDLEALAALSLPTIHYKVLSRNPSVRRDIAFLVSKSVPYEQIARSIESACEPVLERHWLFDVYEGKGIPEGSHSLAVALHFRKLGENFTDEEANQVRERAVTALEAIGATRR